MHLTKRDALFISAIVIGFTFAPVWRILYLNHLVGSASDLFVLLCGVPSYAYIFIMIVVMFALLGYYKLSRHKFL